MHEEWPEYIDDAGEVATAAPRTDLAQRWNQLSLMSALEHLSQRRQQVRTLRRRVTVFAAIALAEAGILLGLLIKYLSG